MDASQLSDLELAKAAAKIMGCTYEIMGWGWTLPNGEPMNKEVHDDDEAVMKILTNSDWGLPVFREMVKLCDDPEKENHEVYCKLHVYRGSIYVRWSGDNLVDSPRHSENDDLRSLAISLVTISNQKDSK